MYHSYSTLLDEVVHTLAVSFPRPVLAPVTIMTFPDKSGMSVTAYLGLGGKDSESMDDNVIPIAVD